MKRLTWALRQIVQSLGSLGLIGIGLVMAALLMQITAIQPVKKEIMQLNSRLTSIKTHPKNVRNYTPNQQLALINNFFPSSMMLSEQLKILHQMTEMRELYMGKVDYKLSKIPSTSLERYDVSYEVIADYPILRQYLSDLLTQLPNAALDNIELQRMNDKGEVPETKLNIVLYYREQS